MCGAPCQHAATPGDTRIDAPAACPPHPLDAALLYPFSQELQLLLGTALPVRLVATMSSMMTLHLLQATPGTLAAGVVATSSLNSTSHLYVLAGQQSGLRSAHLAYDGE